MDNSVLNGSAVKGIGHVSGHTFRHLAALVILLSGLSASNWATAEWFSEQQAIMGTSVSVTLWHEDASVAQAAIDAVMIEMQRIDQALSHYKYSELSRVKSRRATDHAPNQSRAELRSSNFRSQLS